MAASTRGPARGPALAREPGQRACDRGERRRLGVLHPVQQPLTSSRLALALEREQRRDRVGRANATRPRAAAAAAGRRAPAAHRPALRARRRVRRDRAARAAHAARRAVSRRPASASRTRSPPRAPPLPHARAAARAAAPAPNWRPRAPPPPRARRTRAGPPPHVRPRAGRRRRPARSPSPGRDARRSRARVGTPPWPVPPGGSRRAWPGRRGPRPAAAGSRRAARPCPIVIAAVCHEPRRRRLPFELLTRRGRARALHATKRRRGRRRLLVSLCGWDRTLSPSERCWPAGPSAPSRSRTRRARPRQAS